jgi:hypothetical protein
MMNRYAQGSITITHPARPAAAASALEGAFAGLLW